MTVTRRRGQPLAALGLVVLGWMSGRAMLWDEPGVFRMPLAPPIAATPRTGLMPQAHLAASPATAPPTAPLTAPETTPETAPVMAMDQVKPVAKDRSLEVTPVRVIPVRVAESSLGVAPFAFPAGHRAVTAEQRPALGPTVSTPVATRASGDVSARRWRVDSWLAWRAGSGLPRFADGPRAASYGGSQAGVAARFELGASAHRPALHLRASHAPDRPRQSEFAAGAGFRPLLQIPLRVMAEGRVTQTAAQTEVRPAVLAVTELSPLKLPLGLTVDAYAQGGWVGGRYATGFADGQGRLTRDVVRAGPVNLSLGAGAWGGVQRFVRRADVGPTLGLTLAEGPAPLRLWLDYRLRVAGNASPGSGPAVTLSTGFQ